MKKVFHLSLFFFLFSLITFAQDKANSDLIILRDTFCNSYSSPKPILRGTTIKIECDTAYVINKLRYNTYEAAKKSLIKSGSNKNIRELEEKYEAALKQQDQYYKELLKNYQKADSLSERMLTDTREELRSLAVSIESTRKVIDESDRKLQEIREMLRDAQKDARKQKIMAGMAGLGVGILIGVLVH